jgi:regulator of sigma E protease
MNWLTTILAFLVALGLLIMVHELGHFWVARRCGVKVLRFSVGFGRPLARFVRGPDRTEWVIAAIPYGGYVRMLDERDPDSGPIAPEELGRAFNRQSVAKRIAIVLAGPLANLLFAVLIYWVLNVVGVFEPRPVLGLPPAATPAAAAGVADGDLVLAVDGREVRSWNDLRWQLLQRAVDRRVVRLAVRGLDGAERQLAFDLSAVDTGEVDEQWFDRLGIERGAGAPIVHGLAEGDPAERAGIRAGDRILAIDGAAVRSAAEVASRVRAAPGRSVQLRIERDGAPITLDVTPLAIAAPDGKTVGRIGVDFRDLVRVRYGPLDALVEAGRKTWDTSVFSLRMLGRMVEGKASWRNLSGPVTIADVAGQTARIGAAAYLGFMALVSISLGVLNLLPIPVLDGGHLLYYAIEIVTGSPPSERAVELAQRFGIGVLVILTALALYNDLTRLLL